MAKDHKYIALKDLDLSEEDKEIISKAFDINMNCSIKKDVVDIKSLDITERYINTQQSGNYNIDLSFEGTVDECVNSLRDKLNKIVKQITRINDLAVEETIKFNIYVCASGYDGFDECADVTYEATESRHEHEMRQLKIKAIPSVLNAREAYAKIMQEKEEQKKLKEKESFEKELLELKKKYKID